MFQTRLRELRESAGYRSQQAFADAFGVAQSTVGGWEAGKREPNYKTTMRIARFFGVSVDSLLGRDDEKKAPAPKDGDGLDAEQVEIVKLYKEAPPVLRAAAIAVLKSAEGHGKALDDASTAE